MNQELTIKLNQNIEDVLFKNIKIKKDQKIIVIYDEECKLTLAIKEAYKEALKGYNASIIPFTDYKEEEWGEKLRALEKESLVILIQSTSFRISSYRIRLDLINRDIFCIEYVRLGFMKEEEYPTYIDSLTYDFPRQKKISDSLIKKLNKCKTVKIVSTDDSELIYEGGVDEAKSNIADFKETKGTLFPVGEVFTENLDLEKVNGEVLLHAFPSLEQRTLIVKPFKVKIEKGCITSHNGPEAFTKLLTLISSENEDKKVHLREMGFGINKFISKNKPLHDITSHERQEGYHMSLGLKHNVYRKKISKKINQKFHVDIFAEVKEIYIDNNLMFNKEYLIE